MTAPPESRKRALVVIGMHRSGASAMAGVLSLTGSRLPDTPMPAAADTPTGFWEPNAVVAFNDQLMDGRRCCWDDPFCGFDNGLNGQIPDTLIKAAARALADYGDQPLIVVKDPRISVLNSVWEAAFHRAGYDPHYVIMVRHPLEVAASLGDRNGFSREKAVLLWANYMIAAERDTRGRPRTFVAYDALLADWRKPVRRIVRNAGPTERSAAEIDAFLQPSLRHHKADHDPGDRTGVWRWIEPLHAWFEAAAAETAPEADVIDRINAALGELSAIVGPMLTEIRTEKQALRSQVSQLAAFLESPGWIQSSTVAADTTGLRRPAGETAQQSLTLALTRNQALESALADRTAHLISIENQLLALEMRHQALLDSTSWRMTAPLRKFLAPLSGLRTFARRTVRLIYWTFTLQLKSRLADIRRRRLTRPPEPTAISHSRPGAPENEAPPYAAPLQALLRDIHGPEADLAWIGEHLRRYRLPFSGGGDAECSRSDAEIFALAGSLRRRIHSAETGRPEVSIIIPVYNQVIFTLSAVDAILSNPPNRSFEIIIADDASADQTQAVFSEPLPHVVYMRQRKNLGFLRNCNAAATLARGETLVLLNNDTLPVPGWLDELAHALEDPSVGLAGARLIYPDGRLQEAGGIIWRDLSTWNYGRFDDPRRPKYSYRRDVDYVSGAAIALRCDLWRRLGGFDDYLEVAYGEDADLALRIRKMGLRIVFQATADVVHFEGVSSGTDVGTGVKAYQLSNLVRLRRRWGQELFGHRPNGLKPELEKERDIAKRVLVIDHCTPEPDKDAGSVTCLELMKAFQDEGYKVTFIPEDNFHYMPEQTRALQRLGIEAVYGPYYPTVEAYLKDAGDIFDVVVIFRVGATSRQLRTVHRLARRAKVVFHTSDLHFLREERQAKIEHNRDLAKQAAATKQLELGVINEVDVTIVHSTVEQQLLADISPSAKTFVFPWILDPRGPGPGFAARKDMMFLGGLPA